jgi:hypothetical protein
MSLDASPNACTHTCPQYQKQCTSSTTTSYTKDAKPRTPALSHWNTHTKQNKKESASPLVDQIDYPGRVSTPTAGIATAKLLFNSVVSIPNVRLAVFDLKYFHLGTPMARYEYMRIPYQSWPYHNQSLTSTTSYCMYTTDMS